MACSLCFGDEDASRYVAASAKLRAPYKVEPTPRSGLGSSVILARYQSRLWISIPPLLRRRLMISHLAMEAMCVFGRAAWVRSSNLGRSSNASPRWPAWLVHQRRSASAERVVRLDSGCSSGSSRACQPSSYLQAPSFGSRQTPLFAAARLVQKRCIGLGPGTGVCLRASSTNSWPVLPARRHRR